MNVEAPGKSQVWYSSTLRFGSFAIALLTVVVVGIFAYSTERQIMTSRDWVIHSYQVRSQLSSLQMAIMRARASETAYLFTLEDEQLSESRLQADLVPPAVGVLRKQTVDNPAQQTRLSQLVPILEKQIAQLNSQPEASGIHLALSPDARSRQRELVSREQQIDSIVGAMQDEEQSLLDRRLQAWNYLFKRNALMLGLAFLIAAVMLAYNFRLLMAEVTRVRDLEEHERQTSHSLRLLSVRILELQDAERRRIARELHDSVGQYLAGLKINISRLQVESREKFPQLVIETLDLTDHAIQEVRTISHLLHPPLLEELGFLPAARWYAEEFGKRSQVEVSLAVDELVERLPRDIEIALFRVLQEALTNVHRHAAAQCVDIRILCSQGQVKLVVADNGRGIPYDVVARFRAGAAAGIGLAGMRERLAEFGGHLTVESSGTGSVVHAAIPTPTRVPGRTIAPGLSA